MTALIGIIVALLLCMLCVAIFGRTIWSAMAAMVIGFLLFLCVELLVVIRGIDQQKAWMEVQTQQAEK